MDLINDPSMAHTCQENDPVRIYLVGYPGDMGGANTEAWHTLRIWRRLNCEVHLIPTWGTDAKWRSQADTLGCQTHSASPEQLHDIPGLAGSIVVSFCNAAFLANAKILRDLRCKLVWINCMTWLFDAERKHYQDHGTFDVYIFQSRFQQTLLEQELKQYGYNEAQGHLIRGAFSIEEWDYNPRPHGRGEVFVVGRAARPDIDKWSSNTWPIYNRIQYFNKRALMMGMDDRTHAKLGAAPSWADCLKPMALPTRNYFQQLHCTLPVNGGARENWPRIGLEAMAAGVPIVAQNEWGWKEMIEHGTTGFLGNCDEELAHYTAVLAYDEDLRLKVTSAARQKLEKELANPELLSANWQNLLRSLE